MSNESDESNAIVSSDSMPVSDLMIIVERKIYHMVFSSHNFKMN